MNEDGGDTMKSIFKSLVILMSVKVIIVGKEMVVTAVNVYI